MKAGRMRHRLLIEQATTTKNAIGELVKAWTTVVEVNAAIDALSGNEYFSNERDTADVVWKIMLREIPGTKLDPKMRGTDIDTGAIYEFVDVLPSHDRAVYTVSAKSGGQKS